MKRSYPTDPRVERRGVIAFVMSFWKRVFNMVGSWGSPSLGSPQVPLTQKNLSAPSCPGILHICALSVDPRRCLSKFFVICTGWISAEHASGTSSIVLCHGIEGGGVPGRARLNALENRRRQPERGFLATCLTVPVTNLKVFPIQYT